MSTLKRCAIAFAIEVITLVSSVYGQTLLTTPGNGVSIRVQLRYTQPPYNPIPGGPVTWSTVPITVQGAQSGFHYHSPTGAPPGTYTRFDRTTDSNGYATALFTSELTIDNGYAVGYAYQMTATACSPVAQNVCVIIPVATRYIGLVRANPSTGWYTTTDSSHNSQQYAATYFFSQALNLIGSGYHTKNGGKSFMVTRIALPLGGIYDGLLAQAFWLNHYQGSTDGEDHMFGDEADVSLVGMSSADVSYLFSAVTAIQGQSGHPCELWPGTNSMAHIYCGEVPGGAE